MTRGAPVTTRDADMTEVKQTIWSAKLSSPISYNEGCRYDGSETKEEHECQGEISAVTTRDADMTEVKHVSYMEWHVLIPMLQRGMQI